MKILKKFLYNVPVIVDTCCDEGLPIMSFLFIEGGNVPVLLRVEVFVEAPMSVDDSLNEFFEESMDMEPSLGKEEEAIGRF